MKSYDNEKKLVESLLNNKSNISSIQNYIKENYSVDSIYDKEISTLYVWGEKCNEAKTYIKENICDELLDIELSKPNYDIVNEAEAAKVFVLYFDDGTTRTVEGVGGNKVLFDGHWCYTSCGEKYGYAPIFDILCEVENNAEKIHSVN